jgi:polyphosphate kinase
MASDTADPARAADAAPSIAPDSPQAYLNRELSWLSFASRVIALTEDSDLPLLERVKFAGIAGMLHDEFFMKRISGLKRQMLKKSTKLSLDGRSPKEEFDACRAELLDQRSRLDKVLTKQILPGLAEAKLPVLNYEDLDAKQRDVLQEFFVKQIQPILTPLAVDSEHPFPFVSNLGLNLAMLLPDRKGEERRFVRIKVPDNRPRWVPLPEQAGFVPLERVIAANLDLVYPSKKPPKAQLFRVTRGAEGEPDPARELQDEATSEPGSIIRQVSHELKARRFAGAVRLQCDTTMPKKFNRWLAKQIGVGPEDVYPTTGITRSSDLAQFADIKRSDLRFPAHKPITHPRLRGLGRGDATAIFDEIDRGDILLHHPYHSFDSSVLRFIESAAMDPQVLALKLTIYRTSRDSPIVRALAEASRRGKQVAVLVEITARFDEAPNIAWGQYLEREGVHVAYGVEKLKTHVKLALVVREEQDEIRLYAHVGTGNYHEGTAKIYEDVGVLTCKREICDDVAMVFNALTGAMPHGDHRRLLVAPFSMRKRFTRLIRREAEHAKAGRPCGIDAKMNQLQDPQIIRELYAASAAGVPINLNVRGFCCLRPGVPGLSESIRVFGVVGRFLEHSRIYRFTNGGDPEYLIGSADWMRRNLNNRVETIMPILDAELKREFDEIFQVYDEDNCSVWDCGPDGVYTRRTPAKGEERSAAQETFIRRAQGADDEQSATSSKVV